MTTALVLHPGSLALAPPALPARASATPRAAAYEPTYVFGDSTPFPHDTNVIDTIRQVVQCGVTLMRAHASGLEALDRVRGADRRKTEARVRLVALGDSVRRAIATEGIGANGHVDKTAVRILALTRTAIEADGAALESEVNAETRRAKDSLEVARSEAAGAVARFAARHDLPGTRVDLRLVAQSDTYEVEALVTTPFGMTATFRCDVPSSHAWRALRRVRDLSSGTIISLPRQAGVFKKRLEVKKAKLDSLVVLGASVECDRGVLLLGKDESGLTHEIEIDGARGATRVRAREAGEGATDREPYDLSPDDTARVLRLFRAVVASTKDLAARRGEMTDATMDGKALRTVEPGAIATKIVAAIAPLAREIARRSGAEGELVLRKNVGAGRRDEVYVTAAELLEPIRTLPPALRAVFQPLVLEAAPRSPRAPAPSMASYEEIHDADVVEEEVDKNATTLTMV